MWAAKRGCPLRTTFVNPLRAELATLEAKTLLCQQDRKNPDDRPGSGSLNNLAIFTVSSPITPQNGQVSSFHSPQFLERNS